MLLLLGEEAYKRVLYLLFLLAFPLVNQAQCQFPGLPVDSISCKVTYRAVVQVPATAQTTLYRRARSWAVTHFPGGQTVIELDDPQEGRLILRGYIRYERSLTAPQIWRTIILDVKEDRYRYQVSDFVLAIPKTALVRQGKLEPMLQAAGDNTSANPTQRYQYLQRAITETILPELAALQQAMKQADNGF